MDNTERIEQILAALDEVYGVASVCYLNYDPAKNWQLLFAVILSAQCTDQRVNSVTEKLFGKYPELQDIAAAPTSDLEKIVRPAGFYRNKAMAIKSCAQIILHEYGGVMPGSLEVLTAMPGVGRKTANVVRGHVFGVHSIAVDTHVRRVTNRLGIAKHTDPEDLEYELMEILPPSHWIRYNTQLIAHGRAICKARSPNCEVCFLSDMCEGSLAGKGRAVIVSGGSVVDYGFVRAQIRDADTVICADSGYNHAAKMQLSVSVVVGDLDSVGELPCRMPFVRYPTHKDLTDTEIAIDYARLKGFKDFLLVAATGSRLDHTLTNILLLKDFLLRGENAIIIDEHNKVMLTDSQISLQEPPGSIVSLVPLFDCYGVTTKYLEYPLQDAELFVGKGLGVSNVITRSNALISIEDGLLLVIVAKD